LTDVYLALVRVASLSIAVVFFGNHLERRPSRSLEQEVEGLGFSFAAVAEPIEQSAINDASCMPESGSIDSKIMEVMRGRFSAAACSSCDTARSVMVQL